MVRRTIAIGGGLLLLILLVFAFRGCLDARKERAMEDYVRGANELTKLSQAESRQLFDILSAPTDADQTINRENQANALRSDSATLSDRARDLDVPDELSEANDYFVESLDLRRDAPRERWPTSSRARSRDEERRNSTARIAQMMQVFLASDVLLMARFKPVGSRRARRGGRRAPGSREGVTAIPRGHPLGGPGLRRRPDRGHSWDRTAAAPRPELHGNGLVSSRSAAWRSRRAARRPCR